VLAVALLSSRQLRKVSECTLRLIVRLWSLVIVRPPFSDFAFFRSRDRMRQFGSQAHVKRFSKTGEFASRLLIRLEHLGCATRALYIYIVDGPSHSKMEQYVRHVICISLSRDHLRKVPSAQVLSRILASLTRRRSVQSHRTCKLVTMLQRVARTGTSNCTVAETCAKS
jgi:hypothetical protein